MATHIQEIEFGDKPHMSLSDREYDIFARLASGKTVSQIAEQLVLSVKTVSTYRTRVLKKMKLQNNAELLTDHYKITSMSWQCLLYGNKSQPCKRLLKKK